MDDNFYTKISNSFFYNIGEILGDIMIASILWLLCCLPVVTIIPSTSALYYVCRNYRESGLSVTKLFFKAFRKSFKQGAFLSLIYVLYAFISGSSIFFAIYGIGDVKLPAFYLPFSFITLLPILFTLPFVIALHTRFDNSIKKTISNAFILSSMNPVITIYIWILCAIVVGISVAFPPALLILPSLCSYYVVSMCDKIIDKTSGTEEKSEDASSDE